MTDEDRIRLEQQTLEDTNLSELIGYALYTWGIINVLYALEQAALAECKINLRPELGHLYAQIARNIKRTRVSFMSLRAKFL